MVRITCEMCGSNNLIKQDGEYVCQHCGTKYSTEEAKKLMIEVSGKVDISGSTVKIDNQDLVNNSLINARRAKSTGDWIETEHCYDLVKANDPKNTEAIIYSSYAKVMIAISGTDHTNRETRLNIFKRELSTLGNNYDIDDYQDSKDFLEQLSSDIISMCSFRFSQGAVSDQIRVNTYNLFCDINIVFINSLSNIIQKSNNEELTLCLCEIIIKNGKFLRDDARFINKYNNIIPDVRNAYEIIKKTKPFYVLPEKYLKGPMGLWLSLLIILGIIFGSLLLLFIIPYIITSIVR